MTKYRIYFKNKDNTRGFVTVETLAEVKAFIKKNPTSRVFCGRYEVVFRMDGSYYLA